MCLPQKMVHFVGFYIHVMTRDDLDIWDATHNYHTLWFKCGKWDPQYEMTPDCTAPH
jgi:hypothetical protein